MTRTFTSTFIWIRTPPITSLSVWWFPLFGSVSKNPGVIQSGITLLPRSVYWEGAAKPTPRSGRAEFPASSGGEGCRVRLPLRLERIPANAEAEDRTDVVSAFRGRTSAQASLGRSRGVSRAVFPSGGTREDASSIPWLRAASETPVPRGHLATCSHAGADPESRSTSCSSPGV